MIETIYFWFLLLFMIFRIASVSLSAAQINDESMKPAQVIRAIPNDAYNPEVSSMETTKKQTKFKHSITVLLSYLHSNRQVAFLNKLLILKLG